ncbi:MAG: mannose-1-phosphate guanylyltransferase [Parcubacteria group bacterium Gr01-1014_38]|nr:MAG: mannose-1-phosphate guanylyltransferase [Parcubacteria group bacterium Gr01-1014_38]
MNIVIMAGGGGTRLWPVSREKFPKQFAPLVGKKSLLQIAFDHARAVARDLRSIVVTTRRDLAAEVYRQLPHFPRSQVLVESVKRDTAPSIGMAAAFFAATGRHDEPMIQLASDHLVRNSALFRVGLRAQAALLRDRKDRTVLLGAEPTYPETGYGYVERGVRVGQTLGLPVYSVRRFTEKPTLPVAKRYLKTGRFLWNMSIYGWTVGNLLAMFHRYEPTIAKHLDRLQALFARRASWQMLSRVYAGMPSISVDFAITERQPPSTILVIPGAYGWSDIGHWASLAEVVGGRAGAEIKRGTAVQVKSSGNFVYSDVPAVLGLVGIHNLIVVATPDAILVCDRANTQDVKALVSELERAGHQKFL